MFEHKFISFENFDQPCVNSSGREYRRQFNSALNRFNAALMKGKIFRLKSRLMRCRQWLYDLNTLKPDLSVRGSYYAGLQVVSIHSIIGSEGKTTDFDSDFYPIREASRERWVNMAMTYMSRLPLPSVELIQIGDAHFVRDGHHRISVSRAFGQTGIDAEVIVWQAAPPFPWQPEVFQKESLLIKRLDPSS